MRWISGFLGRAFSLGRVVPTTILCAGVASLFSLGWTSAVGGLWARVFGIGAFLLFVFGILERWPKRLPFGIARWATQVIAVGLSVPVCTLTIYLVSTPAGAPAFWSSPERLNGFGLLTFGGVLLAPWVALSALVKQREAKLSELSLAMELQRSEMSRQAVEARMALLTAQVKPHFLFNTLANVHALLETDAERALHVLESLVAYLRAAVPRLNETVWTLSQELDLVQAYLDLMQLRMPDRLIVRWETQPNLGEILCPQLSLLTLVENAVKHGIDPGERGGTVTVCIEADNQGCKFRVTDDGAGIVRQSEGLGTGLAALRERLQLFFGKNVGVRLCPGEPRGAVAEIHFPVRRGQT